ncbi:unnamed protein product [Symbiodinium microadriaticum]|nr:unnamed protein product [Symbiodinium microadriaticum]
MKVFDDFRYGLRSKAPTGVWLPWEEVLFMAGQFGLAPDTCQAAAEAWCSVGAADLDPRPRDCTSGQYVRVRLLPLGDDTDVLSVSSDDDAAAEETQAEPCADGQVVAVPSCADGPVAVDIPLPQSFCAEEVHLLPVFFDLWQTHKKDAALGLDDGLSVDIPAWASDLFQCGFPWTADLVRACSEGGFYDTMEIRPTSAKLALTAKTADVWTYNMVPLETSVPLVLQEQSTSASSTSAGPSGLFLEDEALSWLALALKQHIHEAQWHHWVKTSDRWLAAGTVLRWHLEAE